MTHLIGRRDRSGPASGRWRALTLLAVALVLSMTTWFSASAVITQLRMQWELSDSAAAWLTIAVQLGFVCGALISSLLNLSDIVSPRHVILGGSIGAATVNGLLGVAGGVAVGIPLRFATGFFLAGVYPPALKLMSTWFRKGRGTALGVLVGALTVGSATPHLVNGLGGLDWRVVIYATSVLTLAGGKGINVARALKLLDVPVVATGLAGGRTGTRIVEELTSEAILNDFVRIADESRTSTAVVDPTESSYTEINEWGPKVTTVELEMLLEKLHYLSRGADFVVFAGSLPRGG
jgi:hypothetical protein